MGTNDQTLQTPAAPANLAQASTSAPNFDHIEGHAIEDPSTIGPATQSDPTTMHRLAPGQSAPASDPLSFHPIDKLNQLTEPIENYTQEGRAEHPILSRVGDFTRGTKELLEGGQAAGKPMGTSGGAADEAGVLLTAVDAAKLGASAEELTAKYGPKIAAHAMETINGFTTEARAGIARGMNAHAPVGSTEAGAIKIPTKKSPPSFDHIAGHEEIAPAKKYAYRSRDVGEKGVPSSSPAQATTSEDEARSIMDHRQQITGQPQELVKIPLHNLDPEDYEAKPGPNGADWIKMHRDLGEHEIEPHGEVAPPPAEEEKGDTSFNFGANEKEPVEVPKATKIQFGPDDQSGAEEHARVEQGKGNGVEANPEVAESAEREFKGTHFSNKPIENGVIAGERRGEAQAGSEGERLQHDNKVPGSYYYEDGAKRESQIASRPNKSTVSGNKKIADIGGTEKEEFENAHAAAVEKYKAAGDNDTVANQKGLNDAEAHLRDQGFDGYQNGTSRPGHTFLFGDQKIDASSETDDPYAIRNGSSVITPEGKFVHGMDSHEDPNAIKTKTDFQNGQHSLHVTVPEGGVTREQITALKSGAGKAVGKGGNITVESGDKVSTKEGASADHIEQMITEVGAHPDDKWHAKAELMAANHDAGGIDPRTGESDKAGIGVEIHPEARQNLDHAPTAQDFQDFYAKNQDIFDNHPEYKIGFDNNSNVPGGHELNIGATGKGAARVAKKLEQRSAYDIGKGEEIPTGGTGLRTEFPNYSPEERIRDLKGEPASDIKHFESLSPEVHANLEPDEREYLKGSNVLQANVMKQYHSISPSVPETTNAMQAGAALGGWWQRYIDIFHDLAGGTSAEKQAATVGPNHAEVLKQWHAALSGKKSVQDANNIAWHSYADWLDAGKPTDRKAIDDIIRKNGAQPEGSGKKGNAAISDTLNKKGKVLSKGLDTSKLFSLVNSPEMRGERPFGGDAFNEKTPNPLVAVTEGARKIPSMGATVAGKGNLNRLVIDAHIRDFYGHKNSSGPAAQYIADSVHLRQAAKALGLKGGEGQEQLWGTVLGLKQLLKEGLTPAQASGKLDSDVINNIGKDYAEVIKNDPEISKPGGVLDKLREKFGVQPGRPNDVGSANRETPSAGTASASGPAGSETSIDKTQLEQTAKRILSGISPKKIKAPKKSAPNALDFLASLKNTKAK